MSKFIIITILIITGIAFYNVKAERFDWSLGEPTIVATTTAENIFHWSLGQPVLTASTTARSEIAPSVDSVRTYPASIFIGDDVNFVVNWTDPNAEGIKMLICKTDAITVGASPACTVAEWCSDKDSYDTTDPLECNYTTTASEIGDTDFWAFICDDEPTCSTGFQGSWTTLAISIGTNTQINIGDVWKDIEAIQINIGDTWKAVEGVQINIGDAWKTIY